MLEPSARRDVLRRARDAGVTRILVPGTTVADSRAAVEIAESEEGLFAAVGIHPHEARDFDADRDLRVFEELVRSEKTVAIGEIGLDFHYDHSPRPVQLSAFQAQLRFARNAGLPALLHNRESGPDMLAVLREAGPRVRAGVFHSFTEDASYGREAIGLGYKISFSGMITFKAADGIRRAARELPLEELLVETDAPFLAPVPHRGKPCEPAFVVATARKLAEVRGTALAEIARATTASFETLFLRRGDPPK
jgi:TatD DNase family protein